LRLWPGVVAAGLLALVLYVVPLVFPESGGIAVLGGMAAALVVAAWWLFFSRAPWSDRVGAIVLAALAVAVTRRIVHPSIANGMMGMMLPFYAVPVLSLALVAGLVATRRLSATPRRVAVAAAMLLAGGAFALVRTGGISGEARSDFHWRWTPTPEQRLLARGGDDPVAPPPAPALPPTSEARRPDAAEPASPWPPPAKASAPRPHARSDERPAAKPSAAAEREPAPAWPGFRGPQRDGVVRGVRLETDWSARPPVELWRRPIGPGWSSFAVRGDFLYTQEQRGDDEIVACYKVGTGEPLWRHRDAARFWESNAGAGPRGTPTLAHGRVYTLGATGIVNALDARDGLVVWSRQAATETGVKIPGWGFTSSPLAVGDVVIVALSGRLVAFDAATGHPRWQGATRGGSYSSPHLMTLGGVQQVLLLTANGVASVAPADGALLWQHEWAGVPILQPARTEDGDVLITTGDMSGGAGTRRIAVAHPAGAWTVEERWTSSGLKPYFNDFVVHRGHAFGFDGSILACIDLQDGKRKWKGGRYGHGQLVLLPDQDLLLVLSEDGELALVGATPDPFKEIARFKAIEGKTWNHPALAGDVLLVRNGEEMAAFRLAMAR
jgi:hypothetical protein